jgi:hypothetical protein
LSDCVLSGLGFEPFSFQEVFNEKHFLFCEGTLDPITASLRHSIVGLLLNKQPEFLVDFLRIVKPFPLLFVERLGWFLSYGSDLPIAFFEKDTVLQDILGISWFLQRTKYSKEIAIARNISV